MHVAAWIAEWVCRAALVIPCVGSWYSVLKHATSLIAVLSLIMYANANAMIKCVISRLSMKSVF